MQYKKRLNCLLILAFFSWFTTTSVQGQAQCDCDYDYDNLCQLETYLYVTPETDITEMLEEAIQNYCRIIIPNFTPTQQVIYYMRPITFSGVPNAVNTAVRNKTIILESGVVLEGINASFSECSQSMFTFDGEANQNIQIIGEHDACSLYSTRPVLRMRDYSYSPIYDAIYLVASDGVGDPYLNNSGQPNYIFEDGIGDPYFDNNGNPNIIPPGSNLPKVPSTEEYNDFNCNRTIVAWNPKSWQARHAIAFYGVQKAHVANISIEYVTGDGIHISDDKNGTPTRNVKVENVRFLDNGISGATISSGKCVWFYDCEISHTGSILEFNTTPIVSEGGLLIQEHVNEGSILNSEIEMDSIHLESSFFYRNRERGILVDLPKVAVDADCDDVSDFLFENLCISHSNIGIDFFESNSNQLGRIILERSSVSRCEIGIEIKKEWQGKQTMVWDELKLANNGVQVINQPQSSFCNHWSNIDVCSNTIFELCGDEINCAPGYIPNCGARFACEDEQIDNPDPCDLEIEITSTTEVDCDCDFLFIVDESGSISSEEFAAMEESIVETARDVAECGGRVGLTRFSTGTEWVYGFADTAFCNLDRQFAGGTNIGTAIDLAVDSLNAQEEEYGEEGRCLHVFLHTDAFCSQYNLRNSALPELQDLATSISVIFYDTRVYDEDCHPGLNEQIIDGENGGEFVFGFDSIDINLDDLVDATYTLNIDIDGNCIPTDIIWDENDGGEILSSSSGGLEIETNGEGLYEVQVICSNGCRAFQSFDYEDVEMDTTIYDVPCDSLGVIDDDSRGEGGRRQYISGHGEDELIDVLDTESIDLLIYPNPFNEELSLESEQNNAFGIEVFDLYGRVMYTTTLGEKVRKINISTRDWEGGVYIVQWTLPDGTTQQEKVLLIE